MVDGLLDGPKIPNTGILQEDRMCIGAESFVTAKVANVPKQANSRIVNNPVVLIPILLDRFYLHLCHHFLRPIQFRSLQSLV